MLDVIFRRDSRSRLSSVFASGHVEIAETSSDEYSLVCAAVSAILQAARLGLEAHVKIPLDVNQQSGELSMRWPQSARDDERVLAILETARLSVQQIAAQYPQHVRLRQESEA
ncbi:MAG TPA: ribosomal-processing cysteine protease Prp [Candidatus Baltobacteraceae bacterium]|nr:ribosomal-processing cysteine protease Prp [Candidatus Baltobacteraceae bacterium]